MFKAIATLCFVAALLHFIDNPFSSTPTVQAATDKITTTTSKVQQAATESSTKATALGTAMQNREPTIPDRLKEFLQSTERLALLRSRLVADITAYDTAAEEAYKKFDTEASSITDPNTQKNMTLLRRKTEEDTNDRKQNARQTVDLLDSVLQQGVDLQHAANCVMISTNLHNQGETLDTQLNDARHTATQYEATTNASSTTSAPSSHNDSSHAKTRTQSDTIESGNPPADAPLRLHVKKN